MMCHRSNQGWYQTWLLYMTHFLLERSSDRATYVVASFQTNCRGQQRESIEKHLLHVANAWVDRDQGV